MNHELASPSPESSDNEFDDALYRLQDDTDQDDALLAELDKATIINERLVMDALHIAGLPVGLLKESQNFFGPDAPIEDTLEVLHGLQLAASLQDNPESEQAIEAILHTGLIVERIASNKSLYDMLDPASAARVREEEQLYIINDRTLSANDRETVLRAINLLYEDGLGLDMSNPQTLLAAEQYRTQGLQASAIKDGAQVIRGTLTAIAIEYMNIQGIIEHDDKDSFISGVVVAISREYAVESGLVLVDQLNTEVTKQASTIRLDVSRREARKMGWTDKQFDELIAQLRNGSAVQ